MNVNNDIWRETELEMGTEINCHGLVFHCHFIKDYTYNLKRHIKGKLSRQSDSVYV